MMRILLVRVANDRERLSWAYEDLSPILKKDAFVAPLALATLAALTPDDIEVRIWDEHVRGPATDFAGVDFVGITAFSSQMPRARTLAATVRAAGVRTVIGGPGATAAPETYRNDFDVIFVGEAEQTWPQFLDDLRSGRDVRSEYRAPAVPDLALSPPPRWDAIAADMPRYVTGPVQISRGCPFDCEFCSVWQTFGRKMRTKAIDKVLAEVKTLGRLGMRSILLCSDNFYGAPKYAKALLRELLAYNQTLDAPFLYAAELDINIARDDEFLAMMADANFGSLLIGIESPNKASLLEMRKRQNLRGDLLGNIQHVQSYGVPIDGSIIVGFDHDTPSIFEDMFEFLQLSRMPLPRPHILKAIPGTELYRRLMAEGRIVDPDAIVNTSVREYLDAVLNSNIVPLGMSRAELMSGYARLVQRIFAWENFSARLHAFVAGVTRPPTPREERLGPGYAQMFHQQKRDLPADLVPKYEALLGEVEQARPHLVPMVVRTLLRYTFEVGRVAQIVANAELQLAAIGARPVAS